MFIITFYVIYLVINRRLFSHDRASIDVLSRNIKIIGEVLARHIFNQTAEVRFFCFCLKSERKGACLTSKAIFINNLASR